MNITKADLGWVIATWLIAGLILAAIADWFTGQYEVTRRGRAWFRITRRWYGTRAWVILRVQFDWDEPERFRVDRWDDENTGVPWLLVHSIDDDGADSFWAPVTDFAAWAVRRLRPWIFRYGWLRLPVLFAYETLPSGPDLGQLGPRPGFAGDDLELAPARRRPFVAAEPVAEPALQPGGIVGITGGLEGVLGPVPAEHLEVERERGHIPHRNRGAAG